MALHKDVYIYKCTHIYMYGCVNTHRCVYIYTHIYDHLCPSSKSLSRACKFQNSLDCTIINRVLNNSWVKKDGGKRALVIFRSSSHVLRMCSPHEVRKHCWLEGLSWQGAVRYCQITWDWRLDSPYFSPP